MYSSMFWCSLRSGSVFFYRSYPDNDEFDAAATTYQFKIDVITRALSDAGLETETNFNIADYHRHLPDNGKFWEHQEFSLSVP